MELLKIRTDQFEGPLDLMLFLIQKNELDISAISIHRPDQYVQYCELIREINFDTASEFLLMAATLIHLKSKKLLPEEKLETLDSSEDGLPQSEEELVRRLMEYKKFQGAGGKFHELPQLNKDVFTRPNVPPPEKQTIWRELDLTEMTLTFQDVLKRSRKRTKIIIREPTSIPEKIAQLGTILKEGVMTPFEGLMPEEADKSDIVVTFIALLELSRLKKIRFYQNEVFGSIFVTLTQSLESFDGNLVTGFQYNKEMLHNFVQNSGN